MRISSRLLISFAILLSPNFLLAQAKELKPPPSQTARQALIEVLTGNGAAATKHLTVEMQHMLAEKMGVKLAKGSTPPSEASTSAAPVTPTPETNVRAVSEDNPPPTGGGMVGGILPLAGFGLSSGRGQHLETFDSGPMLLTLTNEKEKLKVEVRVEGDDMRGDQDNLLLSLHIFYDGQERRIPFLENFTVSLKEQEKIWRINEISGNVKITVGDPKFFEDLQAMENRPKEEGQGDEEEASKSPERKRDYPKLPMQDTLNLLAMAEGMYASQNPENGFTCNLSDLVGDKPTGISSMLDPQIASGMYNGYRLAITGCDRKPSDTFRLIAEPIGSGTDSKAYCTDATRNVRSSDDGRGSTCLIAGRAPKSQPPSDEDPD